MVTQFVLRVPLNIVCYVWRVPLTFVKAQLESLFINILMLMFKFARFTIFASLWHWYFFQLLLHTNFKKSTAPLLLLYNTPELRPVIFSFYLNNFNTPVDQKKPAEVETCMIDPCYNLYHWVPDGMTPCSHTCLGGTNIVLMLVLLSQDTGLSNNQALNLE